jgi:hypothetical protein
MNLSRNEEGLRPAEEEGRRSLLHHAQNMFHNQKEAEADLLRPKGGSRNR